MKTYGLRILLNCKEEWERGGVVGGRGWGLVRNNSRHPTQITPLRILTTPFYGRPFVAPSRSSSGCTGARWPIQWDPPSSVFGIPPFFPGHTHSRNIWYEQRPLTFYVDTDSSRSTFTTWEKNTFRPPWSVYIKLLFVCELARCYFHRWEQIASDVCPSAIERDSWIQQHSTDKSRFIIYQNNGSLAPRGIKKRITCSHGASSFIPSENKSHSWTIFPYLLHGYIDKRRCIFERKSILLELRKPAKNKNFLRF